MPPSENVEDEWVFAQKSLSGLGERSHDLKKEVFDKVLNMRLLFHFNDGQVDILLYHESPFIANSPQISLNGLAGGFLRTGQMGHLWHYRNLAHGFCLLDLIYRHFPRGHLLTLFASLIWYICTLRARPVVGCWVGQYISPNAETHSMCRSYRCSVVPLHP